jgi:hypothetical protein
MKYFNELGRNLRFLVFEQSNLLILRHRQFVCSLERELGWLLISQTLVLNWKIDCHRSVNCTVVQEWVPPSTPTHKMSRKRKNEISDMLSNSGKTVKITATPSDLEISPRTMSTLTSTQLTAPSPYSFLNNCTIHGSVTINFSVQNQSLANQQPPQLTFQRTDELSAKRAKRHNNFYHEWKISRAFPTTNVSTYFFRKPTTFTIANS